MKNLFNVFLLSFILLFAMEAQVMGQQKTITGRVTDTLYVIFKLHNTIK